MMKKVTTTAVIAASFFATGVYAASLFKDVPTNHWAHDSIQWANEVGLMKGPGNNPGYFDPAGNVNRAELAIVMQRFYKMMEEEHQELKSDNAKVEEKEEDDEEIKGIDVGETVTPPASYTAKMNGDQETPVVDTAARGTAFFKWNDKGLWYHMTAEGLSGEITAAHIHKGDFGVNGDPVFTIEFDGNTAAGTWEDMTDEQKADLKAGMYYVNIHTEENPAGEIRGQIELNEKTSYYAKIDGSQENPEVDTDAMGTAAMYWNADGDLWYGITVAGLSGEITGAHFHLGKKGENGDVVAPITFDGNTAIGVWKDMTSEQKTQLNNGEYYINIHTEENPAGEIRGQVLIVE